MAVARSKAIAASPERPRAARWSPARKHHTREHPKQRARRGRNVARIVAGVASSHVPAIGAAIDNKQTEEPYWKRVFSGFEKSKEWMKEAKNEVAIIVYNDHASAFSVEFVPTFAIG